MAVVRHNILKDPTSMAQFAHGVNLLKRDFSAGVTTVTLQFPGDPMPVSMYDLFLLWHHIDMTTETPPRNPTGRNFAHRGPIFLPWHRFMLLLFEAHLRRVLDAPSFGLPYWDWTADGDMPVPAPDLWTINAAVGGTGDPVTTGPFAFHAEDPSASFQVFFQFEGFIGGILLDRAGRGLRRQLGQAPGLPLPKTAEVGRLLADESSYDSPDWDTASLGFRNHLESGRDLVAPVPSRLHNGVHGWVSGDMGLTTSPNDPVFYLHHCNVDRLWEAWLTQRGRTYVPTQTTPGAPEGHRLEDEITSFVSAATTTPADMLDVGAFYEYDVLPS
ncbi:MAG: tyrosinase family protein [Egibacteraceae bacterium]